jgi:hypothetical protein
VRTDRNASDAVSGPLTTAATAARQSSNRSFGIVIAVALTVVGCWPLTRGEALRLWALILAACFLVAALLWPQSLATLNRWWTRLGVLLGNIVSPVALAIVYYLAVVPTGLIKRWFGKDTMGLHFDPSAESYWITRDPQARADESMKNQF